MPILDNIRHERFAREIANGRPKCKAYALAGYIGGNSNAIHLWRDKGTTSNKIRRRVKELLEAKELSPDDILNRILHTFELASESGQHASALRAMELLGKQMFSMFTERRENININISQMNKSQLDAFIIDKYGETTGNELLHWLNKSATNPVDSTSHDGVATRTPRLTLVPDQD